MIDATLPAGLFWLAFALVAYHHVAYPVLLKVVAKLRGGQQAVSISLEGDDARLPSVAIVIPAYNEASFIKAKIENLTALDYPADKLSVVIASDGSTDRTVQYAREALADAPHFSADIKDFIINRGKIAVLNEVMADIDADVVVLSDVSSAVEPDALRRIVSHFTSPEVGVVCCAYELDQPGSEGERVYWQYQRRVKELENTVGAMMGAHGAFYAIRGGLFEPIEADTINDDFIIPMRIVGQGYKTVYDTSFSSRELEKTEMGQDFRRRVRISAGAMQQIIRLPELFSLKRPGVAFVFASGKALRALTPFFFVAMLVASGVLATMGEPFYALCFAGLLGLIGLGLFQIFNALESLPKMAHPFAYLAAGHMAGLVGGIRFLARMDKGRWGRASDDGADEFGGEAGGALDTMGMGLFMSDGARVGKRVFDIFVASAAFVVFAIIFPFVALAIKLDSPGPIFYRQLRVGARTETETKLFLLAKFRTMRADAEAKTGAVWASKNDPRITRIGNFLRKTRLDEFPQCLNVLRGDMSIVGPRPERPAFFAKLEREIPFYTERTYGMRPGITGLAQVTTGYDESVDDVREKVLHDHVYATRISRPLECLWTDISICFRTFTVMVLGKGQ
ncbi:MAG: sugar transferase [Pseudomonadota bacterium]